MFFISVLEVLGVGLGLFPSDSLQSQLYEFIEIAHTDHTMV